MEKARRVLAAARRYIAHGWKVIPLEGKVPQKDDTTNKRLGLKSATADLSVVRQWVERWPDMNLGGTPPLGNTIIDVDIYKDPTKLEPLAKELRQHGCPWQRTQSGGAHFIVSGAVPTQSDLCKHHGVKGIDVREHDKGYIVLSPSDGYAWQRNPYDVAAPPLPSTWINGFDYARKLDPIEIMRATAKSIPDLWNAREAKKVRRDLKALDPDIDYPEWIRVGQALHSADNSVGGPAFAAWLAWSQQGSKFKDEQDLRYHWKTFARQGGVTLATLYGMAKDARAARKEDTEGDASEEYVDQDGETFHLAPMSKTALESHDWILRDVLCRGEVTILAGDGGTGKSTFAARLAHLVIHGGYWPAAGFAGGREVPPAGDVLILAAEESAGSGIKPRFMMQKTDQDRVFTLKVKGDPRVQPLVQLSEDLEKLDRTLDKYKEKTGRKIALLVIDPLSGYLGDINQYDEKELRPIMQELVNLSRKQNISILALAHLNKKQDTDFVARILGGVAMKNVPRHVLGLVLDPEDPAHRYCIVSKTNLGSELGLAFVLGSKQEPHPKDPDQRVTWCDIDDELMHGLDADALIRAGRRTREQIATRSEGMPGWLLSAVGNAQASGAEFSELEAHARTHWTEDNPGLETPPTFTQMVKNTLSALCRQGRLAKLHRQAHRGVHQRYYLPEYMDSEFSNALN